MTPEARARCRIDARLQQAGWAVQDMKQLNLSACLKWRASSTPLPFLLEATGELSSVKKAGGNRRSPSKVRS